MKPQNRSSALKNYAHAMIDQLLGPLLAAYVEVTVQYQSVTSWRRFSPFFFTTLLYFIRVCRWSFTHSSLKVTLQHVSQVEV